MKYLLFLLLPFLLLIISCSENVTNPSGDQIVTTDDDLLTAKIIGKWEVKNYETLVLNSNRTFIDTSFAIFADSPNVYVPHCVVEGKYSVDDSILYFYDVILRYAKAASVNPPAVAFAVTMDPRKISFNGDQLNLQFVIILNPLESNYPNLIGRWESISWVAVFDRDIEPQYKGGKKKLDFNFYNDSLKVNYSVEYLFNTSLLNSNYVIDYTFDGINLSIQYINYKVEFRNNKMYWFGYTFNYLK